MRILSKSEIISSETIEGCIALDRNAQKKMYDSLLPYLASVCRRYLRNQSDIDDALQESLVNIFKNIKQYDDEKGSFKTWAVKIAINASLQINKKMYKLRTMELDDERDQKGTSPTIYHELNNAELIEFLKKMPEPLFVVFNMYVVEGFSHSEIAEMIKIDSALSRQRLSRARKWIDHQHNSEFSKGVELGNIS